MRRDHLTDQRNLSEERTLEWPRDSNGDPWKRSGKYLWIYMYLDIARGVQNSDILYESVDHAACVKSGSENRCYENRPRG